MIPCLNAQKKELSQARTFIKSGKNFDKAESLMRNLLKDSANRENIKIHAVLCEAVRKQYEEKNMRLYLKQKVDTGSVFNTALSMFYAYESLDSVDAMPDKKGRIKIKYRQKNAAFLNGYRQNLFNGGAYFISKQDYSKGCEFMEAYIDCARQPLFESLDYPLDPQASYWALFCAYKLQQADRLFSHEEVARKDTAHLEYTLQYLAETSKQVEDTARYEHLLNEGFYRYKNSKYFFTYLVDFYNSSQKPKKALNVIEAALLEYPDNELYLFALSTQHLNMGKNEECIAICDTLIKRNGQLADAYYNAGVAYINLALEKGKTGKRDAKTKKQIKACYESSRKYIERFRQLAPEQKDQWASALYNIYLQLNMGKEFEEIDRLLR